MLLQIAELLKRQNCDSSNLVSFRGLCREWRRVAGKLARKGLLINGDALGEDLQTHCKGLLRAFPNVNKLGVRLNYPLKASGFVHELAGLLNFEQIQSVQMGCGTDLWPVES